jgi:hypothetical protein
MNLRPEKSFTISQEEVQELLESNSLSGDLETLKGFMRKLGLEIEVKTRDCLKIESTALISRKEVLLIPTVFYEDLPCVYTRRELEELRRCYSRTPNLTSISDLLGFVTELNSSPERVERDKYVVNFSPRIPQERVLYIRLLKNEIAHVEPFSPSPIPFYAVGIEKVLSDFQACYARDRLQVPGGLTLTCGEWGYRITMERTHIHSLFQICRQRISVYGYQQLLEMLRTYFLNTFPQKPCTNSLKLLMEFVEGETQLPEKALSFYRKERQERSQELYSLFGETPVQKDPVGIVIGFLFVAM